MGRTRLLALAGLAQMVITLGLGSYLAMEHSAAGLAAAALVAVVTVQAAVQIPVAARLCGLSLVVLFRRAVLPPLLAGVPVAAVMLLLRDRVAVGGLAGLGAWAAGAVATYVLLYWWIGLDAEERQFFKDHLVRLLRPSSVTDWSDPP
jgi:hypothetical protein